MKRGLGMDENYIDSKLIIKTKMITIIIVLVSILALVAFVLFCAGFVEEIARDSEILD